MTLTKKLVAELLGTAWLVIGGCGTAILAGSHVGFAGISAAFGLTVVTMAYAIGHISGCHLNPAVSVGLFVAKRFPAKELGPYVAAQVLGATLGAAIIYVIAGGTPGNFAANGFADGKLLNAFVTEAVLTFFFLFIILGATSSRAPKGFAPLAIGLGLVLIHLISIPITNTSVNPARSTSQAIFAGADALKQLWLFWLAPLAGGVLAGLAYPMLDSDA